MLRLLSLLPSSVRVRRRSYLEFNQHTHEMAIVRDALAPAALPQDESVADFVGEFSRSCWTAWSGRSSPESTRQPRAPQPAQCIPSLSSEKRKQRHTRHDAKPDRTRQPPRAEFSRGTETLARALSGRIGTTCV